MNTKLTLLLSCLPFLSYAITTQELIKDCNSCHGNKGISIERDIPTIAGFSETSINDILFSYRDEERPAIDSKYRSGDITRPETNMVKIAQALTEEQIEALAIYYSELPFKAAKQDFDAALAKKGAKTHKRQCEKCHEDGGSSPDDDAGILAGQWVEYLNASFVSYLDGSRDGDKKMLKKLNKLSPEKIEQLKHFYASQQ